MLKARTNLNLKKLSQYKMKKPFLLLAFGGFLSLHACSQSNATQQNETSATISVPATTLSQQDFIQAAESTVNGVVSVKSYATPQQRYSGGYDPFGDDPFFEYFFGSPRGGRQQQPQEKPQQQQLGLGSGVIITADGYIVTNNHVIDGAERLEVTLNDNRNFEATVIGADPTTDLALIKIDAPDLHVIPMGDSEHLHVGEWVLAVGNPFGFTSSVTSGIVSAKARNISSMTQGRSNGGIEAYIQTDAAVNRGNSGGALVNLRGELVGINTAIYSQTGTYAGCSFAIPTSIVDKVVRDLRQYGAVQRALLGVTFVELSPELISKYDIKGATRGIYVSSVQDRSAALEAGIQEKDVITHINGDEIVNGARMQEIMARCNPGDRVVVSLVRNGKPMKVEVTLRNRSGNTKVTMPETPMGVLGASFQAVPDDIKRKIEISRGVQVTITGDGRFSEAGISNGFIITSVNNVRVSTPEDIEKIFTSVRSLPANEDKVMFISGIYPSGKTAYYAVSLED